ncbi:MAG: HDIG domain-containing metalloprotein [Candidatus Dormibacteraceae bacterium]
MTETTESTTWPTREEAWDLVQGSTQSESLRRHMLAVEAAMRAYATRFGEDPERWAVAGLLHDWDYEQNPTLDRHPTVGIEELRRQGYAEELLTDIASHAQYLGIPRDTNRRKALFAVDELTGFIIACSLVKGRSLSAVEPRSVRKKMKDKAFARGVNREDLTQGALGLGVDFDEHVAFVRDALIPIAPQLGLSA